MNTMTLEVSFLSGTDIKDAFKEAKQKANEFNLAYVQFNFNDVYCSISQRADLDYALKQYNKKYTHICA